MRSVAFEAFIMLHNACMLSACDEPNLNLSHLISAPDSQAPQRSATGTRRAFHWPATRNDCIYSRDELIFAPKLNNND